jgi:hypothetical protein
VGLIGVIVITKSHAAGLADLDEADGRQMFAVGQRIAAAIRRTDLRCEASTSSSPTAPPHSRRSSTSTCT